MQLQAPSLFSPLWNRRFGSVTIAGIAFAALMIGFVSAPVAAEDELPFIHYSSAGSQPRLPSNSVQHIHQDRLGYIWLAYFSTGLSRWDGHRLENFGLRDGVFDPTVREIVEDADGYLWLGTEAGVAVSAEPLDDGRPKFLTQVGDQNLPRTRVRHHWLEAAQGGGVWLGTAGEGVIHLKRVDGGLVRRTVVFDEGVDLQPDVTALVARADGSLWVGLGTGDVVVLDAGAETIRTLDYDAVPEASITAFDEGPNGDLWAGAEDGSFWRWRQEGPTPRFEVLPFALKELVKAILETSTGELWAASVGDGLVIYNSDENDFELVNRRRGLPSQSVWDLTEDREGSLWIGHNAGLSKLLANQRAFRHITGRAYGNEAPVLPEPSVFSVIPPSERHEGLLWVGTGGGLSALDATGRGEDLDTDDGLTSTSIYSMARSNDGLIWLGTAKGLDVLSLGAPLPPPVIPGSARSTRSLRILGRPARLANYGLWNTYTLRMLELPDIGEASCMAGTGGLACHINGSWFLFGPPSGLPASGATAVDVDAEGYLWVGSKDSGLFRSIQPATLDQLESWLGQSNTHRSSVFPVVMSPVFQPVWNRSAGAASDSIRSLWTDRSPSGSNHIWVAHAAGLTALTTDAEPSIIHQFDSESGLGTDHVVSLAASPDGETLWLADNAGLTQLRLEDASVVRRVTRDDGLIDDETWVSHSLQVGEFGAVYHGTPRGLTIYRPDLDVSGDSWPRPRMREVEVQQAANGNNRVRLAWAPLTFVDPDRVRFSVRLRGIDNDWSEPSVDVSTVYTHLPAFVWPRKYLFEVRTSPSPGVWSNEIMSQEVTIQPAWWLRWWMLLVLAVAGVLLARWRRA
ncbi:MAG: hypothetical protein GY906_08295 [bacterium]|nr:hypothetical protein [bacterium]